jgi:prophage tail gpP-like protein
MADSIELKVNNTTITTFESYTVEADLYTADDAFSLELSNPEIEIRPGLKCELFVNGTRELTGIIDRVTKSYDKSGTKLRVEGRDLMGLLVDSCCTKFLDVQGKTVKQLAELLLADIPFINRKAIVYQENFVGRMKGKKQTVSTPAVGFLDTPQKIARIEPGMTVFEVLKTYAASRGLMFWAMPDGTFVFGRPLAGGQPAFSVEVSREKGNVSVLEGELTQDISKRYSRVIVLGQSQGHEDHGSDATKVNSKATRDDTTFPFYKPFVTKMTNDSQSPPLHARLLLEKQKHDGFQLQYRAPFHSIGGRNWGINQLCRVKDDVLGIDGTYLIFGRIFELSKSGGSTTRLKLGYPGVVA